jgi:hypothetical protein
MTVERDGPGVSGRAPLAGIRKYPRNVHTQTLRRKERLKMLNDNEDEDCNGQHVKAISDLPSGLGEDEAEKVVTQKNRFDNNIENYIKIRAREQRESQAKARALTRTRRYIFSSLKIQSVVG